MITIIPIEPINEAHGALIVEAFSRLFIDRGGQPDGYGYGPGDGDGDGDGNGDCFGYGTAGGAGYGDGYSDGMGLGGKCPEAWVVK